MNVAEKRKPQDGRVKTKTPDGNEVELRLFYHANRLR